MFGFGKHKDKASEAARQKVTEDMLVGDIISRYPASVRPLMEAGMHCLGCPSSQMESLKDACHVHGLEPAVIVASVNAALEKEV